MSWEDDVTEPIAPEHEPRPESLTKGQRAAILAELKAALDRLEDRALLARYMDLQHERARASARARRMVGWDRGQSRPSARPGASSGRQ